MLYCCTVLWNRFFPRTYGLDMCKNLEFTFRFEAFYGNDHGKRKHYITDGIENAGLSLHYIGV